MEFITANTGKVRRVTEGGRQFLVAPVALLPRNGVLAGSQGPLYYDESHTARAVNAWHKAPITYAHPTDPFTNANLSASDPGVLDRQGIGEVRDPSFKDKLRATAWFDAERTRNIAPDIYAALMNGQQVAVSTGLGTTQVPRPGTHNGRPYRAWATEHRPDHLAVLPFHERGACHTTDGCGVLVNANPEGCNQHKPCDGDGGSGGAQRAELRAHAEAASGKAEKASAKADASDDAKHHRAAMKAHDVAEAAHHVAGNTEKAAQHNAEYKRHKQAIEGGTSAPGGGGRSRVTWNDMVRCPVPTDVVGNALVAPQPPSSLQESPPASLLERFVGWLVGNSKVPSDGLDPDKACQVLKDGEANGRPLTEAQRGLFGAACGKMEGAVTGNTEYEDRYGEECDPTDDDADEVECERVRNAGKCPECDGEADGDGQCGNCGHTENARQPQGDKGGNYPPNSPLAQPRHTGSGQYLHKGSKVATKQPAAAAKKGAELPEAEGTDDEELGDAEVEPDADDAQDDGVANANPEGCNQYKDCGGSTGHPEVDKALSAPTHADRAAGVYDSAKSFAHMQLAGHGKVEEHVKSAMERALAGASKADLKSAAKAVGLIEKDASKIKEALVQRTVERAGATLRASLIHRDGGRKDAQAALDKAGFAPVQNAAYASYNADWPQERRDRLSDGDFAGPNRSYPVTNQADVDRALLLVNRAQDPSAVMDGIQRIADEKGLVFNANPEGCNQHKSCGGSMKGNRAEHQAAQLLSRRASTASEKADRTNEKEDHEAAVKAHDAAAIAHGNAGNLVRKAEHETQSHYHSSAMRKGTTDNANPEGCNQNSQEWLLTNADMGESASFADDGERGAAFAMMDDHGNKMTQAAHRRSMLAGKANAERKPTEHGKAADAHDAAARHHDEGGDEEMADMHRKAAAEHRSRTTPDQGTGGDMAATPTTMNKGAGSKTAPVLNREQAIKVLTVNCKCDKDRAALNSLSDGALLSLAANAAAKKTVGGEEKGDDGGLNADEAEELDDLELEPKLEGKKATTNRTFADILRNHGSREDIDNYNYSMAILRRDKQQLVNRIVANVADPERKAAYATRLMKKGHAELVDLAGLIPAPVANQQWPAQDDASTPMYIGMGGGPVDQAVLNADADDILPPTASMSYGAAS